MAPGSPIERDFIRALRDHALRTVDLDGARPVVGLTPGEIEDQSGLSRPSVSGLIDRFKPVLEAQDHDGYPVINGSDRVRRWAIKATVGAVLGVEIADEFAQVAIGDLYGRITEKRALHRDDIADHTIHEAVRVIRELLADRPSKEVLGVGISLAAPVEHGRGIALSASDEVWGDWQLMQVREHLQARLGWDQIPFRLDNDANLSALAEYVWGVARPSPVGDRRAYENVIYIEWSRGIGAGLILRGDPYHGAGVAGELGHTVIDLDDNATRCRRCGRLGCLETAIGWEAILRTMPEYKARDVLHDEDLKTALRQAHSDDPQKGEAFATAARTLGLVLGPVIHLLNPELVIIGGDVGNWGYDVIRAPLLECLTRYTMRPALADVTIVAPKLGDEATIQGTLAILLKASSLTAGTLTRFLQRQSK
jgi:predicted NBD/HSP70 family sugar kinase